LPDQAFWQLAPDKCLAMAGDQTTKGYEQKNGEENFEISI